MVISLTVASSCADVAQSVAHLIGSEEVTGPIPVISSCRSYGKPRILRDSGFFRYAEAVFPSVPCEMLCPRIGSSVFPVVHS